MHNHSFSCMNTLQAIIDNKRKAIEDEAGLPRPAKYTRRGDAERLKEELEAKAWEEAVAQYNPSKLDVNATKVGKLPGALKPCHAAITFVRVNPLQCLANWSRLNQKLRSMSPMKKRCGALGPKVNLYAYLVKVTKIGGCG